VEGKKGKGGCRPSGDSLVTSHHDSGAKTAAPVIRHRITIGASSLAASQPRKPEAAQMMDWFYVLPPYQ
jgi:hypothetical protein